MATTTAPAMRGHGLRGAAPRPWIVTPALLVVANLTVLRLHRLRDRRRLERLTRASAVARLPLPARLRRAAMRPWAAIPAVIVVANLLSAAWWDPESWVEFVTGMISDELGKALLMLLDLAFNNPLTVISASEWNVAFAQAAKWGGVFAVIAVAMCAVEIVAGIIAQDGGRVLRGWVWAIAAWPLTSASLLVFSKLVNVSDWLSSSILNSISLDEAGTAANAGLVSAGATAGATALTSMLLGVSAVGFWPLAILCLALILIPVLVLVIVMGAVTFGQVALAAFGPVALMLVGFKGTRAMGQKWLTMSAALLMTKPIATGIVALGCALGTSGGLDGMIMGIIAIIMAIGSPAMAFSFVGFAGAQIGGAMTAHADKVKNMTGGATQAATHKGLDMLAGRAKAASEASKLAQEAGRGDGGNAEGAAAAGGWRGAANKVKAWAQGAAGATPTTQSAPHTPPSGTGARSGAPGGGESASASGPKPGTGSRGPTVSAQDTPGSVPGADSGDVGWQPGDEPVTAEGTASNGGRFSGSEPPAGTTAASSNPPGGYGAGTSNSTTGSTGSFTSTAGSPLGSSSGSPAPTSAGGSSTGSSGSARGDATGSAGSARAAGSAGSAGSAGTADGTSTGEGAATSTTVGGTGGAPTTAPELRPDPSAAQAPTGSPAPEGRAPGRVSPVPPKPAPPAPGQSGPNPFGGPS